MKPRAPHLSEEALTRHTRRKSPARPFQPELGRGATVPNDAVVNSEATRQERHPARQARGIGCIAVGESHRIPRNPVDVRAGVAMVAVASQMVRAQRVDVDV